ncbi:MAG: c-type heme family protein [Coriobacteriia bacterium]
MRQQTPTVGTRMLWILVAAGAIAYLVLFVVVRGGLRDLALNDAKYVAELVTIRTLGVHRYFTEELKPSVFPLSEAVEGPDYFDERWMSSSHAVYRIQEYMENQKAMRDFYYRDVVINARNDEREADDTERAFIRELEADPEANERSMVREFDGEPYYVLMRRGETFTESCMRCHGDPAEAPGDLVATYGDMRGFWRSVGDASIASVRVPLAQPYAAADETTFHLALYLFAIMAGFGGVTLVFTRSQILRPLGAVRDTAVAIAGGELPAGTPVTPRGPREMRELAAAFSILSTKVGDSIATLESRVLERTSELDAMNEELLAEVADREDAERLLESEKRFVENLIDTANVMIVGVDTRANITIFNDEAERVSGRSADEVRGQSLFEVLCPAETCRAMRDAWDSAYAPSIKSGIPVERQEHDTRLITADGQKRRVAWQSGSLVADGKIAGAVFFGTDITESAEQADELDRYRAGLETLVEERTRLLQQTNDRLRAATEAKSRFLASMSHELRTPLNSIIGFTDVLLSGMAGELNEEQGRQLGMVNESGKHLLALVNDVLDLARIERGTTTLEPEEFVLSDVLRGVIDTAEGLAQQRDLTLHSQCPSEPIAMYSDVTKVRQVLLNVIGNAIKYTEHGRIELTCETTDTHVTIHVRDSGRGISAADIERVFDAFWQGGGTTPQGAGLGLAIARSHALLLGGSLTAKSTPGEGSVFSFTFARDLRTVPVDHDADDAVLR